MTLKIINPVDYSEWDRQIAEIPGATIFHTSNWARVLIDSYNYRPSYFCTLVRKKLKNVIPIMEINSPITGKRGVSLPFSDQVEPLVENQDAFDELFRFIIEKGRKNGWRTVDFHGGKGLIEKEHAYATYIAPSILCNGSPDQLFKGFRSSTRRNIQKAEKLGVTFKLSETSADLGEFYRLTCLTRKRHGLPPQPYCFFESILKNIIAEGKGFLCLGLFRGRVIAGVVFFAVNAHAIYKYGASDPQFSDLRPNNLIMAEAIKLALEQGAEKISLGRTEVNQAGLLQFKRGWNTTDTRIHYFKFNISSGKSITNQPLIRKPYFLFRRFPIPLLKMIGRIAYRHIG